jgi:PhnB protein
MGQIYCYLNWPQKKWRIRTRKDASLVLLTFLLRVLSNLLKYHSIAYRRMSESKKRSGSDGGSPSKDQHGSPKKAKDSKHETEHESAATDAAPKKFTLYPYINFHGEGKEAIAHYVKVFGAKAPFVKTFAEGPPGNPEADESMNDQIMHASIQFGDNTIMISDCKKSSNTSNISLCIGCTDLDTMTTAFNALAEGGKVGMPIEKQFWGAYFGTLVDKFGVNWMFNCESQGQGEAN